MALLRGIETTALGKTRSVDIDYAGGGYVDRQGKPVAVTDTTCYSCLHSYYVLDADPIDFCPHCGRRDGAPWTSFDDALRWAQPQQWSYLTKLSLLPFALRRFDGVWVLGFARDARSLFDTGRFAEVRCLRPGEG
jgi:hypothetical protein